METSKKMKKSFRLALMLTIMLLIQVVNLPSIEVLAANTAFSNLDIVFVLDASGSMKSSDPEDIRIEAIKMFMDMCQVKGNKIGLVAYSDNIVREHNLADMNSIGDKDNIKNMATAIPYGQKTDTGLGINEAVKLMDSNHSPQNKPVIILLSDGKNDPQRSINESVKDLENAIKTAKDKGYPVYTIGLNYDGTVDKAQLDNIAGKTNGKSYITNTAEKLPEILTDIYADNSKLKVQNGGTINANGDYQEVTISIPNSNVMEANISMLSNKPVEVKLFDGSGSEVQVPSGNIIFTSSKKYSMLKIIKPSQGDWKLKVKGIKGDKINVSYIFNYDIQVDANINPTSPKLNEEFTIEGYFSNSGQKVSDNELYKNMKAKLIVKNLDNNTSNEVDLENKGDLFLGKYVINDSASYELKVKVDGNSFFRESQPITIKIPGSAKTTTTKPIVKDDKKSISILTISLCALGGILLIVLIIFLIKALKKNSTAGFGRAMLQVRDENTGEVLSPQYRSLHTYKGKFSLYELLGLKEEYSETENLKFVFRNDDSIEVQNNSQCTIQKSGRILSEGSKTRLYNGERIVIILNKTSKTVTFEFYAN